MIPSPRLSRSRLSDSHLAETREPVESDGRLDVRSRYRALRFSLASMSLQESHANHFPDDSHFDRWDVSRRQGFASFRFAGVGISRMYPAHVLDVT